MRRALQSKLARRRAHIPWRLRLARDVDVCPALAPPAAVAAALGSPSVEGFCYAFARLGLAFGGRAGGLQGLLRRGAPRRRGGRGGRA